MANYVFLLATTCCLLATSSASFFFRDPHQQNAHQYNQRENTFVMPPSYASSHSKVETNESPVVPTTTQGPEFGRCNQRASQDFRPHPQDCGRFTMCSAGMLISFNCPAGSVFHASSKSCVPKGSLYDTCTRTAAAPETEEICPRGATYKKAHPKECAQFYHCGQPAREARWEKHLNECDYPMLFNLDSGRCEHFTMVKCGIRREPYDPCEYKANECGSPHCVPCSVRNPSCRSKKDGLNAWAGREGSPHYVVCANQRVVYSGMCDQGQGTQLFDPATKTCKVYTARSEAARFIY